MKLSRVTRGMETLFFRKISVSGFSLMRMGFAIVVLWYGLGQWSDITRFFSEEGLLPPDLEGYVLRDIYRFTIFRWITSPEAVFSVYLVMLAAACCMLIGFLPRSATCIAVLLLFSFHERMSLALGGGDTVLRLVGFLLLFAPIDRGFSLRRLRLQWSTWCSKKTLLPPATMRIWPARLLLWQILVIYTASGWDKILGEMWIDGTAVATALHHPHFARAPMFVMDWITPLSPAISYATIVFEFAWLLLLMPHSMLAALGFSRGAVKRILLVMGALLHGGIFALMDVGSFSAAMMVAYLGILEEEDVLALRGFLNRSWKRRVEKHAKTDSKTRLRSIAILYDGHCGLCQRSIFGLLVLDHLHRLKPVDFRDATKKKITAPDLRFSDLDKAMHVRFSDGTTFKGFDGFRALAWHVPVLWPLAPLLYIPGIPPIGRKIYAHVAARRTRCTHEHCRV